ncbi:hypothetical protein [Paenibacillus protaetiae]|uniref:DUF2759 family protein n=1 Tax=Paenibacillus protaetiae TaxID=2509456 RepID=A0A4P6F119_9BACL|nr:hypothetical protein [Paenibacillus protaetiae]QAY67809.1 hypothetical protein ET464_16850 [Paenibacillus protaetiae]
MFLAEEAAESASNINTFDWFMLAFTLLILIGLIRLLRVKPNKNYFAIGWTCLSLVLFLAIDYIMIFKIWMA